VGAVRSQFDDGQATAVYGQAVTDSQALRAAGRPNKQFDGFLGRLDLLNRSGFFDKASKHAAGSLNNHCANPKRILETRGEHPTF